MESLVPKLGRFFVVVAILISTAIGVVAAERVISGSDVAVGVQGSGIVEIQRSTAITWVSEPVDVVVSPTRNRAGEHYIYCLDVDNSEIGCEQGAISANEGFFFSFSGNSLSRGQHRITARMHRDELGYDNPLIESVSFELLMISKEGDLDGDGLDNEREERLGTNLDDADSDGDDLEDGEEQNQYNTDPLESDSDDDGLSDGNEVTRYGTEPNREDSDNDGIDDEAEIRDHGTDPVRSDTDGDGFDDGAEIRRGSDPTDPNDTPASDNDQGEQSQQQPSSQDSQVSESESPSQDGAQRGFLTNNPDSALAVLHNPLNITVVGFLLSIGGILLQLRRGA